jgi:hypothetical protein
MERECAEPEHCDDSSKSVGAMTIVMRDRSRGARGKRDLLVKRKRVASRYATVRQVTKVGDAPFQGDARDLDLMAGLFVENPDAFRCFVAALLRRGVIVTADAAHILDKDTGYSGEGGRRGRNARRTSEPSADRLFAQSVVQALRNNGTLLFVTATRPRAMSDATLLTSFRRTCVRSGGETLAILDWGVRGEPHVHAIVWAGERGGFVRSFDAWADRRHIHAKARDIKSVTGWDLYVDRGLIAKLEQNIAQIFHYMTKPPRDGRPRHLERDARATGAFTNAFEMFKRNATSSKIVSVSIRRCRACNKELEVRSTAARRYCDGVCRLRAHRRRQRARDIVTTT